MGQSDGWGNPMDSGEVAYLRHAEVGVEENPGTLRCALHTGLWKSAVALRRESANRGMAFIQPLFGGSSACIGVTGLACLPRANVLNRSSAVFRLWRCIATMGQSDDDGGRCGEATADGGEVAYLRHAEVGVEENPGTLRCALHTGLRKSAVALRRESANRPCDGVYTTALRR